MDRAMKKAMTVEQRMLDSIDEAYKDILKPVLSKHRQTLDRLDKLMQDGAMALARVLLRKSGLIEDLANAIADAGKTSSDAIRHGLTEIREVISHDDTG